MRGDNFLELVNDEHVGIGHGHRRSVGDDGGFCCRRSTLCTVAGRFAGCGDNDWRFIVEPALAVRGGQAFEKGGERQVGQALGIAVALIQAEHEVEQVDVVHLLHVGRQLAAHARHRQHDQPLALQAGDQARVDERTLARAGLGVEEHQPLRNHEREQLARLALAAKEELLFTTRKGARPHVGVCHGGVAQGEIGRRICAVVGVARHDSPPR